MNKSLIHVDISNNGIDWTEMEIIGEGLKNNHTILGIHVNGNKAQVDSKGFIIPKSQLTSSTNVYSKNILDTS